jgi:hypothetical protein
LCDIFVCALKWGSLHQYGRVYLGRLLLVASHIKLEGFITFRPSPRL